MRRGRLYKPHLIFRPRQIVRRLQAPQASVKMPWGTTLKVDPSEAIGSGIARTGVHELPVSEAVVRLLKPGDTGVDVGANIGYFTQLMARCVGPGGRVVALEPHPLVAERLRGNAITPAEVVEAAASNGHGVARLAVPDDFATQQGNARLDATGGIEVRTARLDDIVESAAVLKLDCERHELEALTGAERLLEQRSIRHIVFEEHDPLPTPVTERLGECGYTIFRLDESFWGPVLDGDARHASRWDAPNYIATLEPESVQKILGRRGWRALSALYWRGRS